MSLFPREDIYLFFFRFSSSFSLFSFLLPCLNKELCTRLDGICVRNAVVYMYLYVGIWWICFCVRMFVHVNGI